MREETLKCLVHVVEKLDEKNLQEKLVRCITNLQNDTENSIRTNATIFLGRIATKLKDSVRIRVLCPSFAKSMRDNFVHCRVAGLKAATACLNLLDLNQLTTKLMPQVCSLLLDRSNEVRELSLKFLELSTKLMRDNHDVLSVTEKKNIAAAAATNLSNDSPMKNSTSSEKDAGSWASSWASSLSMTIEKTIGASSGSVPGSGIGSSSGASEISNNESSSSANSSSGGVINNKSEDLIKNNNIPKPTPRAATTTSIPTSSSSTSIASLDRNKMGTTGSVVQKLAMSDDWGDNDGFDDWGDESNNNNNDNDNYNSNSNGASGDRNQNQNKAAKSNSNGAVNNGWDADDDLDFDVGTDSNDNCKSNNTSSGNNSRSSEPNSPLKLQTSTSNSTSTSNLSSNFFEDAQGKAKKAPVIPKGMTSKKSVSNSSSSSGPSMKLALTESSDNWDDF